MEKSLNRKSEVEDQKVIVAAGVQRMIKEMAESKQK